MLHFGNFTKFIFSIIDFLGIFSKIPVDFFGGQISLNLSPPPKNPDSRQSPKLVWGGEGGGREKEGSSSSVVLPHLLPFRAMGFCSAFFSLNS